MREKGSATKLFKILGNSDDDQIFRNKVIDVLVNRIWSLHYPIILKAVFLPYLAYAACFIGYLVFDFNILVTRNEKGEEEFKVEQNFL